MKKVLPFLVVLIFGITFFSCKSKDKGGSGPTYTLKMRLADGDKFGQDMDMSMDMNMAAMNMGMIMKMNMAVEMEVLGDSADLKKIRFTYTKAKMSMDMVGLPETGMNTDDIMDKAAERMEGKSIILLLNKDNEIVDVTGFEEMMDDTYNDDLTSREQVKKMFSKDQINSMMGLMFQMYPDHPVRVGDTWEKESDMGMGPLKMRMKNKFKLKQVGNGIATIEIETKYNGKGKMEQGNMSVDMDMNGTQSGEIGIGLDDGYLEGADYKIKVKAKAKVMGQKMAYDMQGSYLMKGH